MKREMAVVQRIVLVLALLQASSAQLMGDNVEYRPDQCLQGDRHKELASPEPEGPDYQACHQWRNSSCCTAEFTQQLAHANVTNIDGFHWNRCEDFSRACQRFFIRVECFYRCSPHVAHWQLPFPSALANLPVCHEFCDEWFEACKDDQTCATNWITDWMYDDEGVNRCQENAPCRQFRDVYRDAQGLCETLWGPSFFYSNYSQNDTDRQCMTLWWPEDAPNPNIVALENMGLGAGRELRAGVTILLGGLLLTLLHS